MLVTDASLISLLFAFSLHVFLNESSVVAVLAAAVAVEEEDWLL